jgi:hypothetical protein
MGNRHSSNRPSSAGPGDRRPSAVAPGDLAFRDVIDRLKTLHEHTAWERKTTKENRPYDQIEVPWTNHKALRASLDIRGTPGQVQHILTTFEDLARIDKDCDHIELVKPSVYPRVDALRYVCRRFAKLTAPREFSVLWAMSTEEENYSLVSSYVDGGSLVPARGGFVMGTCHAYGFLIENLALEGAGEGLDPAVSPVAHSPKCRVHLIMCFDLNGWMPNTLMDHAAPSLHECLDRIQRVCDGETFDAHDTTHAQKDSVRPINFGFRSKSSPRHNQQLRKYQSPGAAEHLHHDAHEMAPTGAGASPKGAAVAGESGGALPRAFAQG